MGGVEVGRQVEQRGTLEGEKTRRDFGGIVGFLIGEIGDLGGDGGGRGGRVVGGRRWASPLLEGVGRIKREKKREQEGKQEHTAAGRGARG